MFSKSLTKHFKGFCSRFTELHSKLGVDTLLDFAIPDKTKHKVKKHFCKNNECSQCGVMWQTDAIGLQSVTLPPLISSFPEAVTTI
jgi:hypothetical protein